MQLISQRIFIAEINRLKQLAITASYSFEQTRKVLTDEVKKPDFNRESNIILNEDIKNSSLKVFTVLHKLKSQAPRYLQELLFTRLISALEIFLIDSIREIGKITPENFKSKELVPYTREQVLSFLTIEELQNSLIEKDCRQLSSLGFQEITKFYKNKLGIDYHSLHPGITRLEEYHERRHILVHRLGQVDDFYRHKYNSTAKRLSVDFSYLNEVIDNLFRFSEELNQKIVKELFGISTLPQPGNNRNLYVLEIRNANILPDCLKPAYQIRKGENTVDLQGILLISSIKNGRLTMVVEGDTEIITLYSKAIHRAHVSGELKIKFANPRKLDRSFFPNKYREKWIKRELEEPGGDAQDTSL
ncbi:MAG: hypothetical protein NUW02_01865 [Candidatus Campbellbacteria bacterium]|nr:hypothetical protein [Candidatus Campbellbacteria bacterium]